MKAVIFALMASFASAATAAEPIYITTELTRNGERVDGFHVPATSGVPLPYTGVEHIKFRDAITQNKVHFSTLPVGTTALTTATLGNDENVRVSVDLHYVRLAKMDSAKMGNLVIDQPRTEEFRLISTELYPLDTPYEFRSVENGVEYVYTVSVAKR
jgi:hypothetical protein